MNTDGSREQPRRHWSRERLGLRQAPPTFTRVGEEVYGKQIQAPRSKRQRTAAVQNLAEWPWPHSPIPVHPWFKILHEELETSALIAEIKLEGEKSNKMKCRVLVIDVGGTHVKVLATGALTERKLVSGPTLTPKQMVD